MESDSDKTRIIKRPGSVPPPVNTNLTPPPVPSSSGDDPDATRILKPEERINRTESQQNVAGDDPTRILHPQGATEDSEKTQLLRRPSKRSNAPAPVNTGPGSSADDPLTGWLVVISGPGTGTYVAVGEQDNRVGRGGGLDAPRVSLDFGDSGIPRSNAFIVRYDPKKRRFKILPGEGSNIVYLNDDDLDGPTEMNSGDIIEISETKLRFVPFCGEGFDWRDTEAE
ncbi:hypothetical protein NT6N_19680 [Oceaniferula spumae]|uniref:FHA domain-containing protein n=1 Tax=Oceaniferula spumae TaxID=2979115 RepID=A0AAT9FLV0_9BACT